MSGTFSNSNNLQLDAKQTQQQHLTMKQRQALEVLFLSRQELETKLSEALLANPLIEVEEVPEEILNISVSQENQPQQTEDESLYEAEIYENSDSWNEILPLPPEPSAFSGESVEDFLLYTPAQERPLRETLQSELNLCRNIPVEVRDAAEHIILNLDDNGMLRTPLEDIAMSCGASMDEVSQALQIVRQFDPPGIGARNIQECLLLQLERKGEKTPLFEKLLKDYFDDLMRNRLDTVVQKLGISMKELEEMFQKLRRLNPVPVTAASQTGSVIIPEVEIVRNEDGTFSAVPLKEKRTYKLSSYADLASSADAGADFAAKAKEGKNLLEALEFRKGTILRMAEMLIDIQHSFLESGPEKLRPFTMKQAAEYLKFKSESTISRAAASKYVKTPHGVFPFKYFFTAGYISEDGNSVSRTADMELLKKLVDEEDKKHPLSDDKLSQLLNKAGHPVARRTVAKYRDLMKIPSSSLRKEHF